jgi:hypothetical protein
MSMLLRNRKGTTINFSDMEFHTTIKKQIIRV